MLLFVEWRAMSVTKPGLERVSYARSATLSYIVIYTYTSLSLSIYIYIYIHMYTYIYIYIYTHKESAPYDTVGGTCSACNFTHTAQYA